MSHLAKFIAALAITGLAAAHATAQAQPGEDSGDGAPQVLVIPLSGTLEGALADAPDRLTLSINQSIAAVGREAVAAGVGKADITAITGCTADSDDCFREVASTIEVDYIIFGSIASSGDDAQVSLTMISSGGEVTRRTIDVKGRTSEEAARGFDPEVRAFLLGEPAPVDTAPVGPNPTGPEPALVVGPTPPPGFAFSRVKNYSWGIAGGGLATIGVGAILLIMADGKQDQVNDAPVDTLDDLEHLADLESSGKSLTSWGNGMLIVGGIATIAGVALVVKQGKTRPATEQPAAPPPTMVTVAPAGRDGGVAITVLGSF